jgi:hypothetical protein
MSSLLLVSVLLPFEEKPQVAYREEWENKATYRGHSRKRYDSEQNVFFASLYEGIFAVCQS